MVGSIKGSDPHNEDGIPRRFFQGLLYFLAKFPSEIFRTEEQQGLEQGHPLFRSRRRQLIPARQHVQIGGSGLLFFDDVGLGRPQPLVPGGQHRPDKGSQTGADPVLVLLGIAPLRIDDLVQVLPE